MHKKTIILTLLSLSFSSLSFAAIPCPNVKAQAVCNNGEWQVNIETIKSKKWFRTSNDIQGKTCQNVNEQTENVRWNYAYQASRPGRVICNFSLMDNHANEIDTIQIAAYDTDYVHTGDNWFRLNYPGNWKCTAGQANCLFARSGGQV